MVLFGMSRRKSCLVCTCRKFTGGKEFCLVAVNFSGFETLYFVRKSRKVRRSGFINLLFGWNKIIYALYTVQCVLPWKYLIIFKRHYKVHNKIYYCMWYIIYHIWRIMKHIIYLSWYDAIFGSFQCILDNPIL